MLHRFFRSGLWISEIYIEFMSEFNDYFFIPVAKLRGMELLIEYTSYDDSIAYFFLLPFPPQFSPSQSMAPGLFYTILAILFYLFF